MKKQIYIQAVALLAIVFHGVFGGSLVAQAGLLGGLSIPSPSSIASDLEKRYNLNTESIQSQGQFFNVAENKKTTPEVSLVFSPSDPRAGQKVTARAFPVYFSDPEDKLYYTWYLKRAGCDLSTNPNRATRDLCDADGDDEITVNDWKITAMGEVVRGGYSNEDEAYANDGDSDGYRARFGGSRNVNTPNHCYIHDNESGTDYEIADAGSISFGCPAGKKAVCVVADEEAVPGEIPSSSLGSSSSSETFAVDSGTCSVSALPACSQSGGVVCGVGAPACVDADVDGDCGSALATCTPSVAANANPSCRHLFPEVKGFVSGDGNFGLDEERFWRTNPNDDSTAENGNKDEANVVGLGQSVLTWNYVSGDQVGVAVEGTSLVPTKHDDSTGMIMWAFPNNDCPISLAQNTGSYTEKIKGYLVEFPTANIDLNECIPKNLVDPTQGGQAGNLNLQMVTTPENPINDETGDEFGDTVTAQVIVDNGQKGANEQQFEWRVELSDNIQFSNAVGTVADVTDDLVAAKLLSGRVAGPGINTLRVALNMKKADSLAGRRFSEYLSNDTGYMRVSVRASENFSSGVVRRGRTDAIVQFTSSQNKITAYSATPTLVGNKMRVATGDRVICEDSGLDRAICRVAKNEIIGLRVDGTGLTNFSWSINGTSLECGTNVSPDCTDAKANEVNFFPVSGDTGSSYNVIVQATDLESGKVVTLSRLFQVVDPTVEILSDNQDVLTPKYLGEYRDLRGEGGCPGGSCSYYSKNVFEGYVGNIFALKTLFIPSFLERSSQIEWEVNGQPVTESEPGKISIDATTAAAGQTVQVKVYALTVQPDDIRRALIDTWGISQIDSAEKRYSQEIQIDVLDQVLDGEETAQGPVQRYLAAIGLALPQGVLYTFRILVAGGLVLFAAMLLLAYLPKEVVISRRPRE